MALDKPGFIWYDVSNIRIDIGTVVTQETAKSKVFDN
jgi:hypothetical protein